MYLHRLYSEPKGLFKPVEFRNGMNIIYGKKLEGQPKNSLNSIGKTTFLDLLDFCLLASAQKNHNPRIFAASEVMEGFSIILEFDIDGVFYAVRRSMDNPRFIEFTDNGNVTTLEDKELKIRLASLIFKRESYKGIFHVSWYRSLMALYLKIQKFKKDKFSDPIKYIKELSEVELNVYHFYLLGFDNTIAFKNYEYRVDQKRLKPTIEEITKFVKEKYGVKDIKETQNEINRLKIETRKLEKAMESFKLGAQYKDAEEEANNLTGRIKEFLYQNHLDREKIKSYQESFADSSDVSDINTRRIARIFNELDKDFGKKVSKTINEALNFRKELSESRKEFLKSEIEKHSSDIQDRLRMMDEFEEERAKLFYFLSAKEAITDLTEAFYNLSSKRNSLTELESNSRILTDLSKELSEIETEINKLKTKSLKFLEDLSESLTDFYEVFSNIFNRVYLDEGGSNFSITENHRKNALLEISVSMSDMFGKGKNQGRTLIYDLSLLTYSQKDSNFPKFLVHDGIFDGVDKSHFISTYELVEEMAESGKKIQYITTLNEEGTLSEKFGNKDVLTPERIESEAVLILSPDKKLFSTNF